MDETGWETWCEMAIEAGCAATEAELAEALEAAHSPDDRSPAEMIDALGCDDVDAILWARTQWGLRV